jgi:hypothetical protein
VTQWNMPKVLLEMVPETALPMAEAAAGAFNIDPVKLEIPESAAPEELQQMSMSERLAHPRVRALSEAIGSAMRADLGPYAVAGWILPLVLGPALQAYPVDDDLVRRCCAFLEAALGGAQ